MASTGSIRRARGHGRATAADARSRIARLALVGRAMLYAMFGLLAVDVATGGRGADSTQGAIERVASQSYGRILLMLLTAGLVLLVAWKVLQALAGDPVEGNETSDRATFALKAAAYSGAAIAAIAVLVANWGNSSGSGGGGGQGGRQQATATVLNWPGGRLIVTVFGVGVILYGLYELYQHALETEFMRRLRFTDAGTSSTVKLAGRIGYGAKAVVTGAVGIFFVVAGLQHDSSNAKGISGVLQQLAGNSAGVVLLWFVAIGLILFAVFSLVEAWLRRAT